MFFTKLGAIAAQIGTSQTSGVVSAGRVGVGNVDRQGGVLRDNRGAEGETVARQADGQTSDKTGGNKISKRSAGSRWILQGWLQVFFNHREQKA